MTVMRRLLFWLAYALLATALAACETVPEPTVRDAAVAAPVVPAGLDPVQEPTDVKYYPSDAPVRLGLEQFNRGNYGLSQRYFKDAVEKAPKDVTAWIGLAASYDLMLRGNLTAARRKFEQAYSLDPGNPVIANNLELLNGSRRFIERSPDAQP
jgi:Tfp pilus assembly protein PilF